MTMLASEAPQVAEVSHEISVTRVDGAAFGPTAASRIAGLQDDGGFDGQDFSGVSAEPAVFPLVGTAASHQVAELSDSTDSTAGDGDTGTGESAFLSLTDWDAR